MCLVERSGSGLNALLGPVPWDQLRPAVSSPGPEDKLRLLVWEAATGQRRKVALIPRVFDRAHDVLPASE